ncbi:MAG: HepT-like ribonuclease domain-containing protein [Candidatus Helarchaeota archaeon]
MKEDKPYLLHIKDAIEKIEKFTEGINFKGFTQNDMIQSAVIRQIEIIGEATNHFF